MAVYVESVLTVVLVAALFSVSEVVPPADPAARTLTLDEALRIAEARQPQLAQAHANTDVARARVDEARATLLPQLSGTASYQRTTANFTPRPGLLPMQINNAAGTVSGPSGETFNFFNFGLTLNQYLWDFRAPFAYGATRGTAEAQAATERSTRVQVVLGVRSAFFVARADKALARVAHENLANQAKHLEQIRGFVQVGTQPEIALATGETSYANAEVQAISADNNYELAKVQLNQAMGVEARPDYEVADDDEQPVAGEDDDARALFDEAIAARPDLESLEDQVRAEHLTVRAAKGGYGPTLAGAMAITDAGTQIGGLVWNWSATVTATWTLFDGLLTWSQVREARATERSLAAQRDALRQQVLVDVSQARLNVRADKAALAAAHKAVENARLQLKLAEGRYQQGVGNVIELSDAQLAYTQSEGQRVQAEYNLATARAQLLRALGRI